MKHKRIVQFLRGAGIGTAPWRIERFAARVHCPPRTLARIVFPAKLLALPLAALPIAVLGSYQLGWLTGVKHSNLVVASLLMMGFVSFVPLFLKLGGLFRYYALLCVLGRSRT